MKKALLKRLARHRRRRLRLENMALTYDNIHEFLVAKWKNSACPRCQSNDWQFSKDDTIAVFLPAGPITLQGPSTSTSNIPMIWVLCKVCGHVEFMGMKLIERWLVSKAEKP